MQNPETLKARELLPRKKRQLDALAAKIGELAEKEGKAQKEAEDLKAQAAELQAALQQSEQAAAEAGALLWHFLVQGHDCLWLIGGA